MVLSIFLLVAGLPGEGRATLEMGLTGYARETFRLRAFISGRLSREDRDRSNWLGILLSRQCASGNGAGRGPPSRIERTSPGSA